jgi:hypothetical protein
MELIESHLGIVSRVRSVLIESFSNITFVLFVYAMVLPDKFCTDQEKYLDSTHI